MDLPIREQYAGSYSEIPTVQDCIGSDGGVIGEPCGSHVIGMGEPCDRMREQCDFIGE